MQRERGSHGQQQLAKSFPTTPLTFDLGQGKAPKILAKAITLPKSLKQSLTLIKCIKSATVFKARQVIAKLSQLMVERNVTLKTTIWKGGLKLLNLPAPDTPYQNGHDFRPQNFGEQTTPKYFQIH